MYPFLAAAIMGIVIYFLKPDSGQKLNLAYFMILLGAVLYFLCIFLFARNEVLADAKISHKSLTKIKWVKFQAVISAYTKKKIIGAMS